MAATACDPRSGLEKLEIATESVAAESETGRRATVCQGLRKRLRQSEILRIAQRKLDLITYPISHKSYAKSAWDWFIVAAILYTSIVIPFEAAFITSATSRLAGGGDYMQSLAVVDQLVSTIFFLDVVLTFRTTFTDERGLIECRSRQIALRYLSGWFFIDVLSILPIDMLFFLSNSDKSAYATGLLKTIKLPRLLRVARKLDSIAINGAAVLSLSIGAFIICCHWLGCMFYGLAMAERPYLPEPKIGWVDNLAETMYLPINDSDPSSGPDIRHRYLASLDFSISCVTNIGLGNTSPNTNLEKIFSIFMMLLGSFLYTGVIRNVNALAAAYGTHGAFRKRMKLLTEFSSFHRLPPVLKERLKRGFRKNWSTTQGHSIKENLHGFPVHLVADVAIFINRAVWKQFDVFEGIDESCLREVAAKMVEMRVPEGHYVLHQGEVVDGIFLILRGSITVKRNGTTQTTLGPGNTMCQTCDPTRSPASSYQSAFDVIALTDCELRKIPEGSMEYFSIYRPDFSERLAAFLRTGFSLRHMASSKEGGSSDCARDETLPAEAAEILEPLSARAGAAQAGEGDSSDPGSSEEDQQRGNPRSVRGGCVVHAEAVVHESAGGLDRRKQSVAHMNKEDDNNSSNTTAAALSEVDTGDGCLDCQRIDIHSKMDLLKERLNQVEFTITDSIEQLRHLLLDQNFI